MLVCKRLTGAGFILLTYATLGFAAGTAEPAAGGEERREAAPEAELSIFVSIEPQRYFAERIAGEIAEVSVLVPPDSGPTTYEPTPRQVSALGDADLYFRIGVPFEEAFIPRIRSALPKLEIVDTSAGIERRHLEAHSHEEEEHDEEHDDEDDAGHSAEEAGPPDPHIWMSPALVKRQAESMLAALVELSPAHRERFQANFEAFAADIDLLDEELRRELEPVRGQTLFVFHPSFGYFADDYGLQQEAIETGGDQPNAARLQELIKEARAEGVRVVFVQPQFSQGAAQRIAEAIDGAVVTVNPLARDWLENMRSIAAEVRRGLQ